MMLNYEQIQQVWENGTCVPNFDPQLYRKDSFGAWICRSNYDSDRTNLSLGWNAIHAVELDQGDANQTVSLQPVQWENEIHLHEKQTVPAVIAHGTINVYHDSKPEI
jgi:hypothetical protein